MYPEGRPTQKKCMILSRYNLKNIPSGPVSIPDEALFQLPEKVLQFGTGVLLRGLPDYFIDKANREGIFNGRIVVVKSTAQGDATAFDRQDGLYTLCIRGIEQQHKVEENIINASISRVLNASEQWKEVLDCAHNPHLQVVISNTTEVGIQLVHDDILSHPPVSFPGKLLAFLYERFKAFGGSENSGMVIVPTELIPDNGSKLEAIVRELAHLNGMEPPFIEWLESRNEFCNSLVDRIVPGRPDSNLQAQLQSSLGYHDELLTLSEGYRLWAIQGNQRVREVLSFAEADTGVVIEPDIGLYRELKLRLLNGTHTLSCGLAFLAGGDTVKTAMDNHSTSNFISRLMHNELAPAIPYDVDPEKARAFGAQVLDRFRNPHIKHQWLSITLQYSSKMKLRCLPVLLRHYQQAATVPELFALGFAAYLLFLKATHQQDGKWYGTAQGGPYPIQDDRAEFYFTKWQTPENVVSESLADRSFWGTDLTLLPGFAASVNRKLDEMRNRGVAEALETTLANRMITV